MRCYPNYSSVSSFSISKQFSIQQQQDLFNKLKEFNLVIISIHKSNALMHGNPINFLNQQFVF